MHAGFVVRYRLPITIPPQPSPDFQKFRGVVKSAEDSDYSDAIGGTAKVRNILFCCSIIFVFVVQQYAARASTWVTYRHYQKEETQVKQKRKPTHEI